MIRIYRENKMNQLEIEISKKFNINQENIFIHSTTIDGIYDLLKGNKRDYLSVSTLSGSTKFLQKYGEGNIFFILESNNVDFHEWGDVGWKGGSPSKTSYDEAGLTNWKIIGILIPPYLNNNTNTIAMAIIGKQIILEETNYELSLPIIGINQSVINRIEIEVDNFFMNNEDKDYGDLLKIVSKKYNF